LEDHQEQGKQVDRRKRKKEEEQGSASLDKEEDFPNFLDFQDPREFTVASQGILGYI
jgi:hypothetical protein